MALEAWCTWLGELTGLEPRWHETPDTIASLPVDLTRMHALLGPTRVGWRDGLRRGIVTMKGTGYVGDKVVVEAEMMAQIAKKVKP